MSRDVKKFTKKKFIYNIGLELLQEFFAQYDGKVKLDLDNLDHESTYNFLLESGDGECPPEIMENLHCIHDLSTPEGVDLIKGQAEDAGVEIVERDGEGNPLDVSIQDMAFMTFLRHREIFDRAHDLFFCYNVKSPTEYAGREEKNLVPKSAQLKAFKRSVTSYFNERYKGKYCEVRDYPDSDEVNIVIYHGKAIAPAAKAITSELRNP